jgi:hypothetical protein
MGLRRVQGGRAAHLTFEEWLDFVRGLAREGERRKAEAHLSLPCRRCRETVSFLERVAATAARAAEAVVPAPVESSARALFLLHRPERIGLLPRLLATLVQASHLQPAPAGVRGLRQFSHQALYEAGDYALDVRLDHQAPARHVSLTGQISDRRQPSRRFGDTPVVVLSGGKVVAHAQSNPFGEFEVEYEPQARLRLCVAVSEGRIEVPLQGLGPRLLGARGRTAPTGSIKVRSEKSNRK